MLLTVTANPSLDRVLELEKLTVGQIHRATGLKLVAAGKGVNVSRAAATLGAPVLATGILAGRNGQTLAELFLAEGGQSAWYWLAAGETRITTLLNQSTGDTTVINESGPTIAPAEWHGFCRHMQQLTEVATAVVFCGSMPPGIPAAAPGELARALAAGGRAVYFDVGYQHLPPLLAQPQGVGVKINRAELAAGLGLTFQTDALAPVIEAGRAVLARGAALVVITLGAAGALVIAPTGEWRAVPPAIPAVSTVGCGDALTAGLVAAQLNGLPIPQALAHGVAAGAANAFNRVPGNFERRTFEQLLRQVEVTVL